MENEFQPCKVDGCDRNAHARSRGLRGYCNSHYLRLRRYGDPLGGGPRRFVRQKWFESALSTQTEECLFWPFGDNGSGYAKARIGSKGCCVHVMMCEAAHGKRPSLAHDAAFTCGNGRKGCVNHRHLVWATWAEIQAMRVLKGTSNRGERCAQSRLKESEVREIRLLLGRQTQQSIADRFGVSIMAINSIAGGRSWAWPT